MVRSATPEDAEAVLEGAREVFATSMHTLTKGDEFTMTLEQEREFLAARLSAPNEAFLIVVPEGSEAGAVGGVGVGGGVGEVWGSLVLFHPKPRRKVRHTVDLGMGIRSTRRGVGVGAALMDAAVRFAQSRPELEIITLAVYEDNAAGRGLYRKFGFVEYGMLPRGCKHDDGSRWDQIYMYKEVGEGKAQSVKASKHT